jgi:hypothetical protein
MTLPLHIGIEHPSLLWLVAVGIVAFLAGLLVNLSRSESETPTQHAVAADDRE